MHCCEFCGFDVPADASFCTNCGSAPGELVAASVTANEYQMVNIDEIDTARLRAMQNAMPVAHQVTDIDKADTAGSVSVPGTMAIPWDIDFIPSDDAELSHSSISPLSDDEEDEEERRRHAVLVGLGLPLLEGIAGEGDLYADNVPMAAGTPQVGEAPFVQHAPPMPEIATNAAPQVPVAPQLPGAHQAPNVAMHFPPPPAEHLPHSAHSPHLPHHPHHPHHPHAPNPHHSHPIHHHARSRVPLWLIAALLVPIIIIASIIGVGFALWTSYHSLHSRTNVVQSNTQPDASPTDTTSSSTSPTATPTVTSTPTGSSAAAATTTPTVVPTATPLPSPTATKMPTGLSCVSPTSITLGPVSEGYNSFTSQQVQLCTTGSGSVTWTASWDQTRAPWLVLDSNTGQISAPRQGQIGVNAYASKLKPGNYNAPITFTSQPGNKTFTVNVSFAVQAGCITGTPGLLTFTGVAGQSDPQTQTVTITNCGAIGAWSASPVTDDGGNWLSINPTGNSLNGGAPTTVTLIASNLTAKLKPGTYRGKIVFSIGSGSFILSVILNVQSPIS